MTYTDALLWQPLLEATAQTLTGAVGSLAVGKAITYFTRKESFSGIMDLWHRGIHISKLGTDDRIEVDCLISPYCQLFPGDPFENAKKWNSLYSFEGKISSQEYQTLEFFAGSDAALRIGSLNGETLVGIYDRYGFIGEGMIGVLSTKLLKHAIPDFFSPKFFGLRANITATLSKCPSQHGFVARGIAIKAGLDFSLQDYSNLWYLSISKIQLRSSLNDRTGTLLGSPWAVTSDFSQQYLTQYAYLSNVDERSDCVNKMLAASNWQQAKVYYDDIDLPDPNLSFKNNYIK